jgi:hypothetical protein
VPHADLAGTTPTSRQPTKTAKGLPMAEQECQDPSRVYRVDGARIAWREMGQEAVVLDLGRSVYFGLNRSAGVLWPRLLAGSTHTALVEALVAAATGPPSPPQAAADVSSFLAAVNAEGLLIPGLSG